MSAFSKLKWYARKPVAVIMAASLVTSTVPVVNLIQAAPVYAAPNREQKEATSDGKFDTSSGQIQIMFDGASHKAGSVTITKQQIIDLLESQQGAAIQALFTYAAGSENEFSQTIDAKLTELEEEDEHEGTFTVDGKPSYKITDIEIAVGPASGGVVKVKDNGDGTWTVSANKAVDSAEALVVNVSSISYQYTFNYIHTYTESEEGEVTEPGTTDPDEGDDSGTGEPTVPSKIEDQGSYPENGKFSEDASGELTKDLPAPSITVVAADYWNGAQNTNSTVDLTGELVFEGSSITGTLLKDQPGNIECTVDLGDAAKYISAEVRREKGSGFWFWQKYNYVVEVTPKHASTEPLSFKVSVESEYGNYTITVNVPAVSPKTVDLSTITTDPIDFRMATDQGASIVEAANAAVKDKTGVADLFESAEITDTNAYYGAATTGSTLTSSSYTMTVNDDAEGASDYNFMTSSEDGTSKQTLPQIPVKAMETVDWSAGSDQSKKLTITGDSLADGVSLNAPSMDLNDGTWFRTGTVAAWSGGSIVLTKDAAPSASTEFASSADFAADSQGIQEASFFVRDDDSKIVRKVTNVTYLHDSVAPGLTAFNAVPGSRQYKSNDKNIWASEKMSVEFWTSEGAAAKDASGINNVDVSYTEQGSSKAEHPKSLQGMSPSDTSEGGYKYEFDIDANARVSTKSIKIDLQDKAGNENKGLGYNDTTTNIDVANLVAQATAPTINVAWDSSDAQNGHYYNHNRSVTFTVNAPFFEYTQEYLGNHAMATITKDGAAWKTVTPGDFNKTGDDTWSCTISFTEDGDYAVSNVNATDVLGRTNTAEGDTFTIDKTAPTMQVTFDNNNVANGKYYNAARTATITVTEHNFDPSLVNIKPTAAPGNGGEVGQPAISGWSTSGDVHTATVTFPGQGVYTLSVDGMDLATNALTPYTCPEFVVDTITPEITISDVENMTAYAGDVAPSVSVHDTNLDSATDIHVEVVGVSPYGEEANPFSTAPSFSATDASVNYRNPADDKANDNVYTVVVNAVDLAGNTSDDAVTFSVNRFGSTYVISDETGKMLNEYLKFDDTSDVRVTEINPSGLDTSQTAVELTRDTSNTTLTADDYTTQQDSTSGWQEYTYTVGRDNYDADGVYRVLFHSQDAAGNVSENEMEGKNAADQSASAQINFAVDDTAPLATFADLTNAEPYNESSHVAKVTFEDNLMLDHAVVEVDGKKVATFDADQLAKNATQEFTINESNGNQSVKVKVYDAAGNEGEASMDNVVVTTNPFELWRRNTPLFAATIAVAVLAVAGIIFAVAKKRSKDDDAEA